MTSMKVIGKFNYIVLIYMMILPNCNLPCRWRIQQSRESSSAESKRGWKVSFQCLFYLKKNQCLFWSFQDQCLTQFFPERALFYLLGLASGVLFLIFIIIFFFIIIIQIIFTVSSFYQLCKSLTLNLFSFRSSPDRKGILKRIISYCKWQLILECQKSRKYGGIW